MVLKVVCSSSTDDPFGGGCHNTCNIALCSILNDILIEQCSMSNSLDVPLPPLEAIMKRNHCVMAFQDFNILANCLYF